MIYKACIHRHSKKKRKKKNFRSKIINVPIIHHRLEMQSFSVVHGDIICKLGRVGEGVRIKNMRRKLVAREYRKKVIKCCSLFDRKGWGH